MHVPTPLQLLVQNFSSYEKTFIQVLYLVAHYIIILTYNNVSSFPFNVSTTFEVNNTGIFIAMSYS